MLVVQRVFGAKRTNLHEKYDYPETGSSGPLLCGSTGAKYGREVSNRIDRQGRAAMSAKPGGGDHLAG